MQYSTPSYLKRTLSAGFQWRSTGMWRFENCFQFPFYCTSHIHAFLKKWIQVRGPHAWDGSFAWAHGIGNSALLSLPEVWTIIMWSPTGAECDNTQLNYTHYTTQLQTNQRNPERGAECGPKDRPPLYEKERKSVTLPPSCSPDPGSRITHGAVW